MIKTIASTMLMSASLLFSFGASAADQDLSSLLGVDVTPMSDAELAQVEGKGHREFPLGDLLFVRANPKLLGTPAWLEKGLNPGFGAAKPNGGALQNANVKGGRS